MNITIRSFGRSLRRAAQLKRWTNVGQWCPKALSYAETWEFESSFQNRIILDVHRLAKKRKNTGLKGSDCAKLNSA